MQGIFDIIGPVMIGPSSSHTAGAARLAAMARQIFGRAPKSAEFYLHGSFAKTYRGHGTDKALVAGALGFRPDDIRLRDAFSIAKENQLIYSFHPVDLGDVHPNSVLIILSDEQGKMNIQGASIGGGSISISKVDDFAVDISGNYNSLIAIYQDKPGVIAAISTELSKLAVNIAFMRVSRQGKGRKALTVIETDQTIPAQTIPMIKSISGLENVMVIPALE